MPLPTFEKQEDIPEAFRGEYAEKNGKWVPKDDDVAAGLRDSQRKLLDEKKKAEDRAANLERALGGRKPEEIEEMLAAAAKAEEDRQKKAGEFDTILEKRKKELLAELEPKVKAGELAARELQDLKFEIAVRELASKAGIPEKNHKAVIRIVKDDALKLIDGKLTVVDAQGDARSIAPDKFFAEEFKTDYAELFAATGGSGGGSGGGGGGGNRGGTPGAIDGRDQNAVLANLDKIAKGEMKVTLG